MDAWIASCVWCVGSLVFLRIWGVNGWRRLNLCSIGSVHQSKPFQSLLYIKWFSFFFYMYYFELLQLTLQPWWLCKLDQHRHQYAHQTLSCKSKARACFAAKRTAWRHIRCARCCQDTDVFISIVMKHLFGDVAFCGFGSQGICQWFNITHLSCCILVSILFPFSYRQLYKKKKKEREVCQFYYMLVIFLFTCCFLIICQEILHKGILEKEIVHGLDCTRINLILNNVWIMICTTLTSGLFMHLGDFCSCWLGLF